MNTHAQTLSKPALIPSSFTPVRSNLLQRKCACGGTGGMTGECEECESKKLQRKAATSQALDSAAPASVHETLSSSGQALDPSTRNLMESRFGHSFSRVSVRPAAPEQMRTQLSVGRADDQSEQEADRAASRVTAGAQAAPGEASTSYDFSRVRVHTDARAAASAREVGALAYTVGNDIVFDAGKYAPESTEGQRLLAHELAHVAQQQSAFAAPVLRRQPAPQPPTQTGTGQAPPPKFTRPAQGPPQAPECEGQRDITTDFRNFVRDVPTLLANAQGMDAAERTRLTTLANEALHSEGTANIDQFTVIACDKINLTVAVHGETMNAFVNPGTKTIGMTTKVEGLMTDFRDTGNRESLITFLRTIAHEKRHATLASPANIGTGGLRPELRGPLATTDAQQASYRVEEILVNAEEIAVARRAIGGNYRVTTDEQTMFQRYWNMVSSRVTDVELARLRSLIIDRLRSRYGFKNGCDNAITLGVVAAMETGRWHICDTGTGRVATPIPDGLKVCEVDGRNPICGAQPAQGAATSGGTTTGGTNAPREPPP